MVATSSWALLMDRMERDIDVRARSPRQDIVECFYDIDWAGSRPNRKSTSNYYGSIRDLSILDEC